MTINICISLFHFLYNKAIGQMIAIAIGRCVNRISFCCAIEMPILQVILYLRMSIVLMIDQLTSTNMRFDNYIHVSEYAIVICNLCLLQIIELIHTTNYMLSFASYVKITNMLHGWSLVYAFLSAPSASLLDRGTCLSKLL